MTIRFSAALPAAVLALGLWAGSASAHEGHDHGDEAKAASTADAPRGSSSTDALELVAVARGGALTVFLDRVDTNEAVADAVVEAETPAGTTKAVPSPDGSYRLDAPWSAAPGGYDVLFKVTVGDRTDLFPVDLDVPAPPAPAAEPAPWHAGLAVAHDFGAHLRSADPMPFLVGGAGFLLGILATVLMRGRRSVAAVALLVLAAASCSPPPPSRTATTTMTRRRRWRPPAPGPRAAPSRRVRVRAQADPAPAGPAHRRDRAGLLPPLGRAARPHHPGPERQRRRAVLGRRPALAAGLRAVPAPRHAGCARARCWRPSRRRSRRSTPRTCARPKATSTSRSPSSSAGSTATGGWPRPPRCPQSQLEDAVAELKGLQDRRAALDRFRQQPEPLVGAGRRGRRRRPRRWPGRWPVPGRWSSRSSTRTASGSRR